MKELSNNLQENIITLLIYNDDHCTLLRNLIPQSLYEGIYYEISRRVYKFIDEYKKAPKDHVFDLFTDILDGKDISRKELYENVFQNIVEFKDHVNVDYTIKSIKSFIGEQNLKQAILKITDLIETKDDDKLDKIKTIFNAASKDQINLFDPGIRLTDLDKSLQFLNEDREKFYTGIKELDCKDLTPARKQLFLFIGLSGSGKCVEENTPILLANGSYKAIKNVCQDKDDEIISFNELTNTFQPAKIKHHINSGRKQCYQVITKSGRTVVVSDVHPFLTPTGWKPIKELQINSYIAVPRILNVWGTKTSTPEVMRTLAYLIADGHLKKSYSFTSNNIQVRKDFEYCINSIGSSITWRTDKNTISGNVNNSLLNKWKHLNNPVKHLIQQCGLENKCAGDKFIPQLIFTQPKELIGEFIKTLFDCDGTVFLKKGRNNSKTLTVSYDTKSFLLGSQLQHLLTRFGIVSKLRHKISKYNGKDYPHYELVFNTKNSYKYVHEIGFGFRKNELANTLLQKVCNTLNSQIDIIPLEIIKNLPDHSLTKELRYAKSAAIKKEGNIAADLFFRKNYQHTYLINKEIMWDSIIKIIPVGDKQTYDLEIEQHHNFVAGNMLVHNTQMLINLARQSLIRGHKILHISCEMSEDRMAERYYSNLFGITKRYEPYKISQFEIDATGNLNNVYTKEYLPKTFFTQDGIRQTLKDKVLDSSYNLGNLYIKEFPTGTLTINGLRAFLDTLESSGFLPDLLLVDYADIMKLPSDQNYRIALGQIYKELRGIAVERNISVVTVSQSNRAGKKAKKIAEDNVAEDWSKVATTDTIITYNQTDAEAALGLARLYVAKARNDSGKATILISQNYAMNQFVRDSHVMTNDYWKLIKDDDSDGYEE